MAKKIIQIIDNHFELAKDNVVYISGDYTKFHMVKMFGSALSIYDDTATLREDWNYYNAIHGADFIRLLDGFMKEYNPIENYDRYEDTNVEFSKGEQVDNFQSAEKNGSIENKVSAFDADGYSNSNKSDTHNDGYTDKSTSGSREDSTDTTSHIHGNIGVTTNAQMLQGEALIRYNDLVNKYIERWARGVLVGYDDYTGDDAGAPVEDYATKAELNAVKDDVNALDTRVDTAENNINRIDTSVNGALEDITELYAQVDEVSNNVNGLTDIVDSNTDDITNLNTEAENLDTRVTALENAPAPVIDEGEIDITLNTGFSIDQGRSIAYRVGKLYMINSRVNYNANIPSNGNVIVGKINATPLKLLFGHIVAGSVVGDVYVGTSGNISITPRSGQINANTNITILINGVLA